MSGSLRGSGLDCAGSENAGSMARFPDVFDPIISERSVALRESVAARHAEKEGDVGGGARVFEPSRVSA